MDNEQIIQDLLDEYNLIDDEIEDEHADNNNANFLGILFMAFIWIEGLRAGSKLVWIPEQEYLYYVNGKNKHGNVACTCIVKGCDARILLRDDGTAQTDSSQHKLHDSSLYPIYKERDLFKWMKDRCRSAPASATLRDIYEEAVKL